MTSASEILSVPEVRGMTELNEDLFKKTISIPALVVKKRDFDNIRRKIRLEKYLLNNLAKLKNTMPDDLIGEENMLILFNPDAVNNDKVKEEIAQQVKEVVVSLPDWKVKKLEITFDNWDTKSLFRAILPDGTDFSSFTQTGHIIHCNFRSELEPYKKIIADILLKKIKNARTVVNKVDGIKSEYRNFQIELVAGEENYITSVLERGITYKMDFSSVFWNSRLQHEHERVLKFLSKNSLVFDACAGIGPFVLPAAKQKHCKTIFANDLNPESVKWMEVNRETNKIKPDQVKIFNMDAIEFIKGPIAEEFVKVLSREKPETGEDIQGAHILMNLPGYSVNFLPAFKGLLHGKINHIKTENIFPIFVYSYLFVKAPGEDELSTFKDRAVEMVKEKLNWKDNSKDKFISSHHVRTVSSYKEMFCMKIQLPISDLLDKEEEEPTAKRAKTQEDN